MGEGHCLKLKPFPADQLCVVLGEECFTIQGGGVVSGP